MCLSAESEIKDYKNNGEGSGQKRSLRNGAHSPQLLLWLHISIHLTARAVLSRLYENWRDPRFAPYQALFAQWRKATTCFVMSALRSAWKILRVPQDGFSRNSILEVFLSKSSRENTYFIKICKADYLRLMYIYVNISFNSSSNEKWSDKSCTQNHDTFCHIPFFPPKKSCRL